MGYYLPTIDTRWNTRQVQSVLPRISTTMPGAQGRATALVAGISVRARVSSVKVKGMQVNGSSGAGKWLGQCQVSAMNCLGIAVSSIGLAICPWIFLNCILRRGCFGEYRLMIWKSEWESCFWAAAWALSITS